MLIMEISFGQFLLGGRCRVFGSFSPRMRGVEMSSIACAYMLVVYYSMLLAWVTHAFFVPFNNADPWANEDATGKGMNASTVCKWYYDLQGTLLYVSTFAHLTIFHQYRGRRLLHGHYYCYGHIGWESQASAHCATECWLFCHRLIHCLSVSCLWPQVDWSRHLHHDRSPDCAHLCLSGLCLYPYWLFWCNQGCKYYTIQHRCLYCDPVIVVVGIYFLP